MAKVFSIENGVAFGMGGITVIIPPSSDLPPEAPRTRQELSVVEDPDGKPRVTGTIWWLGGNLLDLIKEQRDGMRKAMSEYNARKSAESPAD